MAAFEPILTRNWNVPDGHALKTYESRGGYQAVRKALTTMDPDAIVQLVKGSELRGRGGAGFPTGLKWTFLPKDRQETLMCINGDESEPTTFNNRLLLEKNPHLFLEGILISCFATKAKTAYIYLRIEYYHAYRVMDRAIAEARAAGHIGKNIYGSGFDLNVWLHRGAGAYICGEETGLIESLEGERLAANQAAVSGDRRGVSQADRRQQHRNALLRSLHRRAGRGLVQVDRHAQKLRPETLLRVWSREQASLCRTPLRHDQPRVDRRTRRRNLERSQGQGGRPRRDQHGSLVERRTRRAAGLRGNSRDRLPRSRHRGLDGDGRPDEDRRLSVQYRSLLRARKLRSMHAVPRRVRWMLKTITRIRNGGGRLEDLDILAQQAETLGLTPGTTICGLADGAAWPFKNAIAKFRPELEDFIRTHQDPAHAVNPLQNAIAQGKRADDGGTSMPNPLALLPGPNSWTGNGKAISHV